MRPLLIITRFVRVRIHLLLTGATAEDNESIKSICKKEDGIIAIKEDDMGKKRYPDVPTWKVLRSPKIFESKTDPEALIICHDTTANFVYDTVCQHGIHMSVI